MTGRRKKKAILRLRADAFQSRLMTSEHGGSQMTPSTSCWPTPKKRVVRETKPKKCIVFSCRISRGSFIYFFFLIKLRLSTLLWPRPKTVSRLFCNSEKKKGGKLPIAQAHVLPPFSEKNPMQTTPPFLFFFPGAIRRKKKRIFFWWFSPVKKRPQGKDPQIYSKKLNFSVAPFSLGSVVLVSCGVCLCLSGRLFLLRACMRSKDTNASKSGSGD